MRAGPRGRDTSLHARSACQKNSRVLHAGRDDAREHTHAPWRPRPPRSCGTRRGRRASCAAARPAATSAHARPRACVHACARACAYVHVCLHECARACKPASGALCVRRARVRACVRLHSRAWGLPRPAAAAVQVARPRAQQQRPRTQDRVRACTPARACAYTHVRPRARVSSLRPAQKRACMPACARGCSRALAYIRASVPACMRARVQACVRRPRVHTCVRVHSCAWRLPHACLRASQTCKHNLRARVLTRCVRPAAAAAYTRSFGCRLPGFAALTRSRGCTRTCSRHG